jgi:hypothetical protein
LVRVGEEADLESSAVTGEVAAFGAATVPGSPWYIHNVVTEALYYKQARRRHSTLLTSRLAAWGRAGDFLRVGEKAGLDCTVVVAGTTAGSDFAPETVRG